MLEVDGQVAAWALGLVCRGTFLRRHVGYDPGRVRVFPGVVLELERIRYLTDCGNVQVIDLMCGDNDVKKRISNEGWFERSYYLFPRTFSGTSRCLALLIANRLAEAAGAGLERVGLKRGLTTLLRR